MTPEQAQALRKPFDTKTIGVLPKPYSKDSPKRNCEECGGYHGMPAAHLDFVGHAAVTDRLLAVDPAWTWEPFAVGENGLPVYDNAGGLWIKLTVCGVTRLGYGDGPDPKQRIGDAIRNGAMRFGVALDLWSRQELESDPNGGDAASGTSTHVVIEAHNAAQEQARAETTPEQPSKEEYLAAFLEHLYAGPEDRTARGVATFYAKALAAAAKQRLLTEPVPDQAGTTMTVKELIEQEQLRVEAA